MDGGTSRSVTIVWSRGAPWGFPPGISVDPIGKTFPKSLRRKNPPRPKVLIKGNPPHYEMLPRRDIPLGKGVLTHGNLKPLDILLPPS
jgi:hypothetical protein